MKYPVVSRVVFDLVSLKNRRCRFTERILHATVYRLRFLCQKCQNNQRFVMDSCVVIPRIIKLFYRDLLDKMAVSNKLNRARNILLYMTIIF